MEGNGKPKRRNAKALLDFSSIACDGSIPSLKDIASLFIVKFGGADAFVGEMVREYNGSKSGSMQRVRLLSCILSIMEKAGGDNLSSLDKADDGELQRIVLEEYERIQLDQNDD